MTDGTQSKDQDAGQIADQIAQAASQATQRAEQIAQKVAQDSQAVEQAVQAVQSAARGVGAETSAATIETEITPASIGHAWAANNKLVFDNLVNERFSSMEMSRRLSEELAQAHLDQVRALNAQNLRLHTNSITHDVDMNAQKLRHNELSIDRIWNPDEVAQITAVIVAILAKMGISVPSTMA